MKFLSAQNDNLTLNASALAPVFSYNYEKKLELKQNEVIIEKLKNTNLPSGRTLEININSREYGVLYRNAITYRNLVPLKMCYLYTDIPKQQLVMVFANQKLGSGSNKIVVNWRCQTTKEIAFTQTGIIPDNLPTVPVKLDILGLPAGQYLLEYKVLSLKDQPLLSDYEEYAKYTGKTPWDEIKVGLDLDNKISSPWTPVEAADNLFKCWGRNIIPGGKGLLSSIITANCELLKRPVSLLVNGQTVGFNSKLIKSSQIQADYVLTPKNSPVDFTVEMKAEFDGVMWFEVKIPGKGEKIDSLVLSLPLQRKYVDAFDDNVNMFYKTSLIEPQEKVIYNNVINNPFFWCGGNNIGIMGGTHSYRGWRVKNKAHSMSVAVNNEEILLNINLLDTPLTLNEERKMAFYLQPTPVKPLSQKVLRSRECITDMHVSWFNKYHFESTLPGHLEENRWHYYYSLIRPPAKKEDVTKHWYNTPKGLGPYTPDYNYFGRLWHNSPPAFGEYYADRMCSDRTLRNRNIFTYGCLNCPNFLDFKLYLLNHLIKNPIFPVNDLYFDLCWPRGCNNSNHGCGWIDEFGDSIQDNDLKPLREYMLRAYRMIKEKNPDTFMIGHLLNTRTPSDSFFDMLYVGELYDSKIFKTESYYDVLTPELMRIAYASRTNEMRVSLIPQFLRAIGLFAPGRLAAYQREYQSPKAVNTHRHLVAYQEVHGMAAFHRCFNASVEFQAAEDLLGWENKKFYPYWEKNSPMQKLSPSEPRIMASAYSNQGKVLAVVLNDTQKTQKIKLKFDTSELGMKYNSGKELLSGKNICLNNESIEISMEPLDAALLLFNDNNK
jgi:hypothetical protein